MFQIKLVNEATCDGEFERLWLDLYVCLSVFMYSSEEFAWTNSNAIKKKVIFVRTSYIYCKFKERPELIEE